MPNDQGTLLVQMALPFLLYPQAPTSFPSSWQCLESSSVVNIEKDHMLEVH